MSNKRNVVFSPGEFYHVFNRSNGGEQIFNLKSEIKRALELLDYYRFEQNLRFSFYRNLNDSDREKFLKRNILKKPLAEIYAYALMPNHFHFLLKEKQPKGIRLFLSNFQNSYARFLNTKNKRNGSLFQSPFKAVHINGEKEFLHISRYIHLNPVTSFLIDFEELKKSKLTSFPMYINEEKLFINTSFITDIFGSISKYQDFIEDQIDYQRNLNIIRHILIDK